MRERENECNEATKPCPEPPCPKELLRAKARTLRDVGRKYLDLADEFDQASESIEFAPPSIQAILLGVGTPVVV